MVAGGGEPECGRGVAERAVVGGVADGDVAGAAGVDAVPEAADGLAAGRGQPTVQPLMVRWCRVGHRDLTLEAAGPGVDRPVGGGAGAGAGRWAAGWSREPCGGARGRRRIVVGGGWSAGVVGGVVLWNCVKNCQISPEVQVRASLGWRTRPPGWGCGRRRTRPTAPGIRRGSPSRSVVMWVRLPWPARAGSARCSRCSGRTCRAATVRCEMFSTLSWVPWMPEVGDRLGAAVAAAQVGAGEHRDRAEDGGPGAGDRVAHRAAVAPAQREHAGVVSTHRSPSISLVRSSTRVRSRPLVLAQPLSMPCGATKIVLLFDSG